ncbi:isocitrate dehydrogenase [Candidatus Roizmanbacteria bacterium CG_4_10_14_0_2_um_filter_36_35]|uniref:Isocitrate/homoisocitrate dehydrogenase n=4 Tax=Candidatus Roizmaniibacteriota TaxID=1752723 RepID=A0A2M7AVQ4_9BACT|nr:MAG: isocitrate dehydrogenase [Candidatus Roizmanbacteria bacterium CG07_land_8_20_14_0_80_34_15]PIU74701.1 MAG: isocitrate dehydrogenase [Candidatus Roizmanbacteria bacterium CG06_land_8_20_14_3_00_34_14]PIW73284.1 MAG: isocitrate dehydrogenase [Candidatus Roizmanbacteria bacterium CG_4_8_14_3_um_filter_34_9]PIZ67709.1 MAG: isocitrate dehydrogenase [Candidatus Roizmanbacteria bacterium CG_4_10_14_0_2_um_filter_36_35]
MKKKYQICYMGGDGIGPDVTKESLRLLQATGIGFNFIKGEIGFEAYKKYDTPLPEKTIEICKKSDAILFGAITTPPNIKGYFSPIVRLRKILDLYANVRPFKSLPIPDQKQGIDFIIVRENTEDLYVGQERLTKEGAIAERVITKKGCEKIIKFAFELAKKQDRKKVTVVHKANILRITDGLFLDIAKKISISYPNIVMEDMLVDSCAMQLIKKTEAFDIIVTTNMFGDILSDEAAGLTGGLGVAASGNIGNNQGLFEPVHGSAPKYAGKNIVNPTASFLSSTMMLEFLGEDKMAQKIRKSITKTIEIGLTTKDLGGSLKSSEFTDKIINNL